MIMHGQDEDNWCWAAVAVSIHDFLHGGAGSQAQLATPVLRYEKQITSGVNCVSTPALCDLSAALDDALRINGDLAPDGFLRRQCLLFTSVKAYVDAKLPVGARIAWWGGGGHFVAIDGYREFASGLRQVRVKDPWYGESYQNYGSLVSDFYYESAGRWNDSYLVER